jgi:hypothetical protein
LTTNAAVRRSAFGVHRLKVPLLACAAASIVVVSTATQSDESPLVAAMKDELARSMSELRIKDEPAPYYIEYHVDETVTMRTAARLGAIEVNDRDSRLRTLEVDVRVGDYQFDSSRFVVSQGRGGFSPQGRQRGRRSTTTTTRSAGSCGWRPTPPTSAPSTRSRARRRPSRIGRQTTRCRISRRRRRPEPSAPRRPGRRHRSIGRSGPAICRRS